MLAELTPLHPSRPLWPRPISSDRRIAVLVNANARGASERVIRSLRHVLPEEDLLISHTEEDARRYAALVLDRDYDVVFCGGGDGTFVTFVNEMFREQDRRPGPRRIPRFGMLRLGTGNGLATLLKASPTRGDRILDDVLRTKASEVPGYRRVDLMRANGRRTIFAGLGIDGRIINDYNWVKTTLGKGALRTVMTGGPGYVASVALRTVPHYLRHSAYTECELVNGRQPAYRLDADGKRVGEPIGPGELIFRGKLNLAAAGTIPFYGFGMRAFPFAGLRPGMMHLRLAAVTCASVIANLPSIWKGRWFPSTMHEFHVAEVIARFDKPMALEVGGDAGGYRDEVRLDMAPEHVELVDFNAPVN